MCLDIGRLTIDMIALRQAIVHQPAGPDPNMLRLSRKDLLLLPVDRDDLEIQ